jgi:phosphopentomutase
MQLNLQKDDLGSFILEQYPNGKCQQDTKGYSSALEEFDVKLPDIQKCIGDGDLLVLIADYGNDPTDQGTDHMRENVPLLCASNSGKKNINLGVRCSFADVGRTAAEIFGVGGAQSLVGQSFLEEIF